MSRKPDARNHALVETEPQGSPHPRGAGRPAPSDLPLEEQVDKAREAALRLLRVKERSAADLRARLRAKGFSAEAVTRVVDRLVETGLQDDARFAEGFVRSARSRGNAASRILRDLRAWGLPAAAAAEAVTEGPDVELGRARALAAGRAAAMAALPPEVRARRLAGLLARRGYDPETIASLVEELASPGQAQGP